MLKKDTCGILGNRALLIISLCLVAGLVSTSAAYIFFLAPVENDEHEERVIYVMDYHDRVLFIMRSMGFTNVSLLHIDFHDDIRESLIDIEGKKHYMLEYKTPEDTAVLKKYEHLTCPVAGTVDVGNFLSYAVSEGIVTTLEWVHGTPGGRFTPDKCVVLYRSDMTDYDFINYTETRTPDPLDYKETLNEDWDGLEADWQLNIDWDFFASKHLPKEDISAKTEEFFKRDWNYIPEVTYLCYSPYYSHDSRELFNNFTTDLAEKFGATVEIYKEH